MLTLDDLEITMDPAKIINIHGPSHDPNFADVVTVVMAERRV